LVSASLVLLIVGIVTTVRTQTPVSEAPEPLVTLQTALAALDHGDLSRARRMAQAMQAQGNLRTEDRGGPAFVLGAVEAIEAEQSWGKDQTRRYRLAAESLEQARDCGFPAGRQGEGLYLLGKSLYRGGQITASRPVLRAALKVNPARSAEIHGLLAAAALQDARPDLPEALAENERYLSDTSLPAGLRHDGMVRNAQILLRMDKTVECLAALDALPAAIKDRADAILLRGQALMREAELLTGKKDAPASASLEANQKYRAAIQILRRAEGRDTLTVHATPRALYLIGLCLIEINDLQAAIQEFGRVQKQFPDTDESLAACFREADVLRRLGRDNDAVASYQRALRAVPATEAFQNPWIPAEKLRLQALVAYQDLLTRGKFEACLQLVAAFCPLFPETRTMELKAEIYQNWGRSLMAGVEAMTPDQAERVQRQARIELRRAAAAWLQLATTQFTTRQYPDLLWNSAENYLAGQDYRNAVRVLRKYLEYEFRRRHAQALVALGEALLALDETDKAIESFQDCMTYHPRDAAASRARLFAARAWMEKGQPARAESLLRENLEGSMLAPASKEWRDSLFSLGELLHAVGRYREAAQRLEEAVARYPDTPRAQTARYLAADAYRRCAWEVGEQLDREAAPEARARLARQRQNLLEESLKQYGEVCEALRVRHQTRPLSAAEKGLLQNSYFAIAGVQFELGRFDAAIKAYATITTRYPDDPEVLEAFLQMANLYRRLERPAEARTTLRQAKILLDRLKNDASFTRTTNYTRQQWNELLETMTNS